MENINEILLRLKDSIDKDQKEEVSKILHYILEALPSKISTTSQTYILW